MCKIKQPIFHLHPYQRQNQLQFHNEIWQATSWRTVSSGCSMHRGQYRIHHSPPPHSKNTGIITNKFQGFPWKLKFRTQIFFPFQFCLSTVFFHYCMLKSTQEEQWDNANYKGWAHGIYMCFIKFHFLHYLFVLSVAALNNSSSHLLLFPERTTLCGERKEQHQSGCTKTQNSWCGSQLLTGKPLLVQLRPRQFLEISLLSTHIRNKPSKCTFTSNGQLSRTSGVYFEDVLCECCCGTAGVPWHGMHSPYTTSWANINKGMSETLKRLWHTVSTVFFCPWSGYYPHFGL